MINGCEGAEGSSFQAKKWRHFEADQLPPSGADVKNGWVNTSSSSYILMVWSESAAGSNMSFPK